MSDNSAVLPMGLGIAQWADAVYNLEQGKTTEEPFGTATVYFEGSTNELSYLVAGSLILSPGQEPHPPHQHPEEEFLFIGEGTGEILIDGETTTVQAGSVMFSKGDSLHGIKNTGTVPMRFYYFKWLK